MGTVNVSGDIYSIDTSGRKFDISIAKQGLPGRGVPLGGVDGQVIICRSGRPVWGQSTAQEIVIDLSDLGPDVGVSVEEVLRSAFESLASLSARIDTKITKGDVPETVPVMVKDGGVEYRPIEQLPSDAVQAVIESSAFEEALMCSIIFS